MTLLDWLGGSLEHVLSWINEFLLREWRWDLCRWFIFYRANITNSFLALLTRALLVEDLDIVRLGSRSLLTSWIMSWEWAYHLSLFCWSKLCVTYDRALTRARDIGFSHWWVVWSLASVWLLTNIDFLCWAQWIVTLLSREGRLVLTISSGEFLSFHSSYHVVLRSKGLQVLVDWKVGSDWWHFLCLL